ncbi:CHASE3 domain-containing protein [Silvibacterium sp.]|uniref:CHASE3 domain-containing protein n=1 Tax=Silvibacterium sp. TaxID=1964179 RepID=UPI0039E720F4
MNLAEFRRILKQTAILPILLLVIMGGLALALIRQSSTATTALDVSDRITADIIDLEKLILDQETGLRGYELTHDPSLLQPYETAAAQMPQSFQALSEKLRDRRRQPLRLANLRDRYQLWLAFSQSVLARPADHLTDPAADVKGKVLMDGIRDEIREMLEAETRARNIRLEAVRLRQKQEFFVILLASLVIGIVLALFTRNRLHRVSRSYQTALAQISQTSHNLYDSQQKYLTTLESIGDAVISCDLNGNIEFMNAVAQDLTGWTASEAIGRPLQDVFNIIHEETREIAENPVDKVRRLNQVIGLANHTALISRQGKEFVIDDSAAPIRNAQGEMTGIVLVFRNVTEKKRTEAALIAGEKLAVAGRLAATIAHEIHNPLDSVANLLYLLTGEENPEKRSEYLQMAQQELGRTMQISRTMLSLYREPKAPVNIDLQELIDGVLLLLDRRIQQLSIRTELQVVDTATIEGFPAELRQVFTNVFVNAIEAAGLFGSIAITLSKAPPEELLPAGIIVEVADSGAGFPPASIEHLFQPFFTTKGDQGTGLGLWVSMGIVQKHGGTIRVRNGDSEPFSGAHVSIYLPTRSLLHTAPRIAAPPAVS